MDLDPWELAALQGGGAPPPGAPGVDPSISDYLSTLASQGGKGDPSSDLFAPKQTSLGILSGGDPITPPPTPAALQGILGPVPQQAAQPPTPAIFQPQGQQQPAAPPPQAMPTPPQAPQMNPFLGFLDNVTTGGRFGMAQDANYKHQQDNYNTAVSQLQVQRMMDYAKTLSPNDQAQFLADPKGFLGQQMAVRQAQGTEAAKNLAPMALNSDQRGMVAGKIINAAPGKYTIDPSSGRVFNDMTGQASDDSLGGGFDANGFSGRTGQQVPVQSFQKVGAGETGSFVAPQLLQAAPPPAVGGQPPWTHGVPNATTTSTMRSPAHNADVGGVQNSYHLTGQAADVVPQGNETMGQLFARMQQTYPDAKVINEGTHVHIQPRSNVPHSLQGPTFTLGAAGTQVAPNGEVSAMPTLLKPSERMEQVGKFNEISAVKDYNSTADALNSLYGVMPKMTNNNGIIGAQAFGAQVRGVSGGIERPATVKIMTEQMSLPQEVSSFIQNNFKNDSKLTPEMFNQILASLETSASVKQKQAQRVLQAYEEQVPHGQQPLGLSLEPIGQRPQVSWLDGSAGVNTGNGSGGGPGGGTSGANGGPRLSPQQAAQLPKGTPFVGLDGLPRIKS